MPLPPTFVPGFHDETAVRKMKYHDFGATGLKISELSLGTAGFSKIYGSYTIEDCKATINKALRVGINYIDTAPWYGNGVSEEVLGKCLEGIPRKAYYLATKVGRYETNPKLMFDYSAQRTKKSIETSLKKLKLDYVDFIQVHDIEFAESLDIILQETLPVLNEIIQTGKARFIGVTGYHVSTLNECIHLSKTKINSVLSYSRLCLLDNTLKQHIHNFQSKKLGIVNAAGNCLGLLTNSGPQSWHPAPIEIKNICTEARDYCKKENVELAKLSLYYCLNQKGPHTTLVGMNTVGLLDSNLDVVYNGITGHEKNTLEYLQSRVFKKLTRGDWEQENEEIKSSLPKQKGKVFL